jgi:hypothetical protein
MLRSIHLLTTAWRCLHLDPNHDKHGGLSLLGAGTASAQNTDIGGGVVHTDIDNSGRLVPWGSTAASLVSFMLGEDTTR